MKKLNLSTSILGELSSEEIGSINGGLLRASDSQNTKFTKICECCKTGCPTSQSTDQTDTKLKP